MLSIYLVQRPNEKSPNSIKIQIFAKNYRPLLDHSYENTNIYI